MSFDLFIIWGNGLDFIPEIIYEIREDDNYQIMQLKVSFLND